MTKAAAAVAAEATIGKDQIRKEVQSIVDAADLVSVHLQSSHTFATIAPHSVEPIQLNLKGEPQITWEMMPDRKSIFCYVGVSVRAERPDAKTEEEALVYVINANFCAIYKLGEFEAGDEAVKAFSTGTAVKAVFPFLREFVDQASRRMGFKPALLPLLKMQTTLKDE